MHRSSVSGLLVNFRRGAQRTQNFCRATLDGGRVPSLSFLLSIVMSKHMLHLMRLPWNAACRSRSCKCPACSVATLQQPLRLELL